MESDVNPAMLVLARETRGMTQRDLATETGISQGKVSKYENGLLTVTDEDLIAFCEVLNYPQEFFLLDEKRHGVGSSTAYFRKHKTVASSITRLIEAKAERLYIHVKQLLKAADIESEHRFPRFDVDEFNDDIEHIAQLVRQSWRLPAGPIDNVVEAIENAGGIVHRCDFGTDRIDGISHWVPPLPPVFLLNEIKPGDRQRFTLAHEIGHVVMHDIITKPAEILEDEANKFAAAFLMPEQEFELDLEPVNLARFAQLKLRWKVAIQAQVMRAHELGKITQRQKNYLFEQISRLGYRKEEPNPIPPEETLLLKGLMEVHLDDLNYTVAELAQVLALNVDEMRTEYLHQDRKRRLYIVDTPPSSNAIQLTDVRRKSRGDTRQDGQNKETGLR